MLSPGLWLPEQNGVLCSLLVHKAKVRKIELSRLSCAEKKDQYICLQVLKDMLAFCFENVNLLKSMFHSKFWENFFFFFKGRQFSLNQMF